MKTSLLMLQILSLMVLASCQPQSGEYMAVAPASAIGNLEDGGLCSEIIAYQACVSAGCEPVLATDKADVNIGEEEELFARCIPKIPADNGVFDIIDDGETAGADAGAGSGGEAGGQPVVVIVDKPQPIPSSGSCNDIAAKHKRGKKVLICHNSNKGRHSIEISCSALNTHKSHHDDTVGACPAE